ncbi:hypothetical protein ACO1K3_14085, partial [Staphylococcus aureus]
HVDYLSSVSGGGWISGALAARASHKVAEPAERPMSPTKWRALVNTLRFRGDYLRPGGIGLTANTFRPVITVVWGAAINLTSL